MRQQDKKRISMIAVSLTGLALLCVAATRTFACVLDSTGALGNIDAFYGFLHSWQMLPLSLPLLWTAAALALNKSRSLASYVSYVGFLTLALMIVFIMVTLAKIILAFDAPLEINGTR